MISPILTYGAEVWGFKVRKHIETAHINFCKYTLEVGSKTHSEAIMGELGRRPMWVLYYAKCIKYWLKLLLMENSRLPKSCYNMLYMLDQNDKITWVTHIKNMLFENGFGVIFLCQTVGDEDAFMYSFRQRL